VFRFQCAKPVFKVIRSKLLFVFLFTLSFFYSSLGFSQVFSQGSSQGFSENLATTNSDDETVLVESHLETDLEILSEPDSEIENLKPLKSSFETQRWRILETDPLPQKKSSNPYKTDIENEINDQIFKMQEFDTNYITLGKPDTKVQFSFKFKFFAKTNVYLGYTQIMFWDLFRKESYPFSEINFNPELFYRWNLDTYFFKEVDIGYAHISNGKDESESRSVDSAYLRLITYSRFPFGIPRLQFLFRYLTNEDKTNKDITDYYGPVVIKFFFDKLGKKIFKSEELYFEYYNGGDLAQDFSKSSVRVSARFKIFASQAAPKVFIQYFNGYGENLANYNFREETYRIGFSIGGF
jgi:phospholipase A1/A2